LNKQVKKFADMTLGVLIRAIIRYCILHPILLLLYRIEVRGEQDARSCTNGSIVAPNHVSFLDGPFLMSLAWPLARIRFVVWHAEYTQWFQWPIMRLCGAICAGSPKDLPKEERARRKATTLSIMSKVLASNRALGIFPQGKIAGERVEIQPHLSGLFDLILNNPDKPLLLVKIDGLQYSRLGKCTPKTSFFKRLPVTVTIRRFDNVSLDGGAPGLNKRIEDYFNYGTLLATNSKT
jgi:1-acyl-sn-glycerol-3-phosphate acyltransferase